MQLRAPLVLLLLVSFTSACQPSRQAKQVVKTYFDQMQSLNQGGDSGFQPPEAMGLKSGNTLESNSTLGLPETLHAGTPVEVILEAPFLCRSNEFSNACENGMNSRPWQDIWIGLVVEYVDSAVPGRNHLLQLYKATFIGNGQGSDVGRLFRATFTPIRTPRADEVVRVSAFGAMAPFGSKIGVNDYWIRGNAWTQIPNFQAIPTFFGMSQEVRVIEPDSQLAQGSIFKDIGKVFHAGQYLRGVNNGKILNIAEVDGPENKLGNHYFGGTRYYNQLPPAQYPEALRHCKVGSSRGSFGLHKFDAHRGLATAQDAATFSGMGLTNSQITGLNGTIGALRALKGYGANAIKYLTLTFHGDGCDFSPFVDDANGVPMVDRYDVNKLRYMYRYAKKANEIGLLAHVTYMEEENDAILGNLFTSNAEDLESYIGVMRDLHKGLPGIVTDLGEEFDTDVGGNADLRADEAALRSRHFAQFLTLDPHGIHSDQLRMGSNGSAWDGFMYRVFNMTRTIAAAPTFSTFFVQFDDDQASEIAHYYNDDFRRRVNPNVMLWFSENGPATSGINGNYHPTHPAAPIRKMMDMIYNRLPFSKIAAQGVYFGYFENNPRTQAHPFGIPGDITLDDFRIYSNVLNRVGSMNRYIADSINFDRAIEAHDRVRNARASEYQTQLASDAKSRKALALEEPCSVLVAYFPQGTMGLDGATGAKVDLSFGATQAVRQNHLYERKLINIENQRVLLDDQLSGQTVTGGRKTLPAYEGQILGIFKRINGNSCQ